MKRCECGSTHFTSVCTAPIPVEIAVSDGKITPLVRLGDLFDGSYDNPLGSVECAACHKLYDSFGDIPDRSAL